MYEVKLSLVNAKLADLGIKIVADTAPAPGPTPPGPTPPPKPPPADGIIDCSYKDILHHYNPVSLAEQRPPNGWGVSMIFCVGDKYESVTFNGTPFRCLDRDDEGREWWSNIDYRTQQPTHMAGTVLAKNKNGKTYRFTIPAGGKSYMDYKGKCFGKKR